MSSHDPRRAQPSLSRPTEAGPATAGHESETPRAARQDEGGRSSSGRVIVGVPVSRPWSYTTRFNQASGFPNGSVEALIHVGEIGKGRGNAFAIVSLGGLGATSLMPIDIEATAEFIVRACNAHEELVRAAKTVYDLIGTADQGPRDGGNDHSWRIPWTAQATDAFAALWRAIAKAESK